MAVKRDQDSVRTGRRRFSNESKLGFIEKLGRTRDKMHRAWCKSMQLQTALWARTYMDETQGSCEW